MSNKSFSKCFYNKRQTIKVIDLSLFFPFSGTSVSADKESSSQRAAKNLVVARRLFAVVVSDFLCWFPVCVLGLLAASGTQVNKQVNVAVSILVLPLNSALNPFLYTVNVLMEKREKTRMDKLEKKIRRLYKV